LPELIASLSKIGSVKRIILETSGILWRELPQEKLTVVLSPKPPTMKDEFPLEGVFRFLETFKDVQLKIGVLTEEDLNFAVSVFKKARKYRVKEFVIQPIDIGKDYEKTSKSVVEMVLKRREVLELNVRVIPQIHKFLGMK
jgi:7-carboxy-7-deazaguanine synthase